MSALSALWKAGSGFPVDACASEVTPLLRAFAQVPWRCSARATVNFHWEVAAYHPLPKTPCAAIGRCASRGCLPSLGGPIERLPPVQTRHVHASGGASDSASQREHEGQKHPREGPEGEALHRHEFFVLAVPYYLPFYLPLRDAGGEGRCLGDACVGGGHTNDRGGLPGGRGLSCMEGGCRVWKGVVVHGRGLSCMSGAARARGARGAALSERVQESRNGTLKG